MNVGPFTIAIADKQLADLDRLLRDTRWPDGIDGMDWRDGTDLLFLRRLADYWRNGFDWRAQEARLNALPQYVAELYGHRIHFVHRRGAGPAPFPRRSSTRQPHGAWRRARMDTCIGPNLRRPRPR